MNLLVDGLEEKTVFKTELTKQLSIDNHTEVYPVYKIRLDKLYYNDQNDRSKTLPAQLIEKAYEQLDNVDTNVFKKLSDDEKDNIRSKLDLVQEMIDSIRGELDV